MLRIATWNINSLNARMHRVEEWLGYARPDVLCLQETKLADDAYPALELEALGYRGVHHGTGGRNGVAILSRHDITEPVSGWADGGEPDRDPRIVTARTAGVLAVSVYVPNGRSLGHEQYHYKLEWLARLRSHLDALTTPDQPVVVCGDFNVAPDDRDCYDPKAFENETHTSEPERAAIAALLDWGLVDTFRTHHDEDGLYSWWDYRAGNFHKRKGLRIDLVLASEPLAERSRFALVDRNARKGKQPSDHAPVLVDFDVDPAS